MTGLLMFLHAVISVLLIVVILMQSGRGGGLTEGFASAESLFGAKTNEFMIKTTTVVATLFFVTCLGLAIFSSQKGKSLMSNKVAPAVPKVPTEQTTPDDVMNDAVNQVDDAIVAGGEETLTTPKTKPLESTPPDTLDDVVSENK